MSEHRFVAGHHKACTGDGVDRVHAIDVPGAPPPTRLNAPCLSSHGAPPPSVRFLETRLRWRPSQFIVLLLLDGSRQPTSPSATLVCNAARCATKRPPCTQLYRPCPHPATRLPSHPHPLLWRAPEQPPQLPQRPTARAPFHLVRHRSDHLRLVGRRPALGRARRRTEPERGRARRHRHRGGALRLRVSLAGLPLLVEGAFFMARASAFGSALLARR